MNISQDKRKRLAYVARRYYLEDQRQSDIARELGISRPMVSRLLAEARELGVVEITVHDPETRAARLLDRLRSISTIQGGVLVEDSGDNDEVNRLLSQGALQLLQQLGGFVCVQPQSIRQTGGFHRLRMGKQHGFQRAKLLSFCHCVLSFLLRCVRSSCRVPLSST